MVFSFFYKTNVITMNMNMLIVILVVETFSLDYFLDTRKSFSKRRHCKNSIETRKIIF